MYLIFIILYSKLILIKPHHLKKKKYPLLLGVEEFEYFEAVFFLKSIFNKIKSINLLLQTNCVKVFPT